MAFDRLKIFFEVAPVLCYFGYSPHDIDILGAIANHENQKRREKLDKLVAEGKLTIYDKAFYKSYSRSSARALGFETGISYSRVRESLRNLVATNILLQFKRNEHGVEADWYALNMDTFTYLKSLVDEVKAYNKKRPRNQTRVPHHPKPPKGGKAPLPSLPAWVANKPRPKDSETTEEEEGVATGTVTEISATSTTASQDFDPYFWAMSLTSDFEGHTKKDIQRSVHYFWAGEGESDSFWRSKVKTMPDLQKHLPKMIEQALESGAKLPGGLFLRSEQNDPNCSECQGSGFRVSDNYACPCRESSDPAWFLAWKSQHERRAA